MSLDYILSELAEADMEDVLDYTVDNWGEEQAERYFSLLHGVFESLTRLPESGRLFGHRRPGLRRIESGKHVVLYRVLPDGIRIVRVLHQRMLLLLHNLDDET